MKGPRTRTGKDECMEEGFSASNLCRTLQKTEGVGLLCAAMGAELGADEGSPRESDFS